MDKSFETLVSSFRHKSELIIPNFNSPTLFRRNEITRSRGLCVYVRIGFTACRMSQYECNCHEVLIIRVCSRFNNFYIFTAYRNPDLNDSIFDYLIESMANIQNNDRKAAFLFIGDFNAHHREWLNSASPTNGHGRRAYDFANLSGCHQLVDKPIHNLGNTLDLLLTDVPGIVDATVSQPVGTSDHNSILVNITTDFPVPNYSNSFKILIKSSINWDLVANKLSLINWPDIYSDECPVSAFNSKVKDIIDRFVPSRVIKTRKHDKPWFNIDCRRALNDEQAAYHLWTRYRSDICWDNYVFHRNNANNIYSGAKCSYNLHLRDKLRESGNGNSQKWWKTLKSSLFGADVSLPPIFKPDGSVTHDPAEKASLFAAYFNEKQSDFVFNAPDSCDPQPVLTSLAFRSRELLGYMKELDNSALHLILTVCSLCCSLTCILVKLPYGIIESLQFLSIY